MNKKIMLAVCFCGTCVITAAQRPGAKPVRIADSLTAKEKLERDPVLLRSELDSLMTVYAPAKKESLPVVTAPVKRDNSAIYIFAGLTVIFLATCGVLVLVYRQRKHLLLLTQNEKTNRPGLSGGNKNGKKPVTARSPEERIGELTAELHKLSKENESLGRVISEYNGVQHEYDSLRHGIQKTYKVKNYPGYEKAKDESQAMQGVLDTENALVAYAYEKFLKPVLIVTDANKNSPAKMSVADREKLLDLLISLSLLYIEYLYLRVSDLSVGGTIVERIKAFANGNPPDPALLKKLNTESGSRALVIRMALNKASVTHLSYPVFDETNLNSQ
ncbi:MAG: hypothetical protein ACT4OJ_16430 [Bacteroidota bacterium]